MTNVNDKISAKIGVKIKLLRTKQKLSQEELGFKAGLNKNSIGGIERGENVPSIDTLYQIANALGITLVDLVDITKVDL